MRSSFDALTGYGKEGMVYVESTVAAVPTLRALSQRQSWIYRLRWQKNNRVEREQVGIYGRRLSILVLQILPLRMLSNSNGKFFLSHTVFLSWKSGSDVSVWCHVAM